MLKQKCYILLLIMSTGLGLDHTAFANEETTILPGYWQSHNVATFLLSKETEEKICITKSEVSNYINGLSNRHYRCTYDKKTVEDGNIKLNGQCVDKHGTRFDVIVNGHYAPESFALQASFSLPGFPVSGSATTDAKRISDTCPKKPDAP